MSECVYGGGGGFSMLHFFPLFLFCRSPHLVAKQAAKPHDFSVVISSGLFFQGCYYGGSARPPVSPLPPLTKKFPSTVSYAVFT